MAVMFSAPKTPQVNAASARRYTDWRYFKDAENE